MFVLASDETKNRGGPDWNIPPEERTVQSK